MVGPPLRWRLREQSKFVVMAIQRRSSLAASILNLGSTLQSLLNQGPATELVAREDARHLEEALEVDPLGVERPVELVDCVRDGCVLGDEINQPVRAGANLVSPGAQKSDKADPKTH